MSEDPWGDRAAGPRISYLVKRVEQGSRSLIDERLKVFGVTLNQYTALSVLRLRAGLSSAELARRSFVTAQAMNLVVTALEAQGFLVREPDPAHRKILRAYLTPAGSRLLDVCDQAIDEVERTMVDGLDAEEQRLLGRALARCAASLDAVRLARSGGGSVVGDEALDGA